MPGMTIMAPADERELRDMLRTALALEAPVAIRYPRGQGVGADTEGPMQVLPVGRGRIVRGGDALTILSVGTMLAPALVAAEQLAAEGIAAGVVDARFVKPLDEALILQRAALGPLVTVEENALAGGFGAGVVELLQDRGLGATPVRRLGVPDRFISHGSKPRLWANLGLDAAGIAAAARSLLPSG